MELCEETLQMEIDYIPPPSLVDTEESGGAVDGVTDYISKWIVNPANIWKDQWSEVLSKATNPFTLWFRGQFNEQAILNIADEFVMKNPHSVLNVVFDFAKPLPKPFLDRLIDLIGNPDLFINRSYYPLYEEGEIMSVNTIMILPDPGVQRLRDVLLDQYSQSAQIVWETSEADEEKLATVPAPLLISGAWTTDPETGSRLMDFLWSIHSDRPEEVLFKNPKLAAKWEIKYCKKGSGGQFPERILRT